ncbi:MAG TPA: hypothetical protein VMM17_01765 [Gemmatimonadaceae bacterium]|nr:hypothetical protein [Gemmatimonadaceae bacterium]
MNSTRVGVLLIRGAVACAGATVAACAPPVTTGNDVAPVAMADTTTAGLIPPGFGTLRQDEIAIRLQPPGLVVRAIPLDETLIRLLTPDSYRTLHDLRMSTAGRLTGVAQRLGGRAVEPWLVSFFGVEPDVRFTPMDLIVTSAGRDFRPLEVVPLSAGFGEQRLRQRETQTAVFVFEADIDVNQPLTLTFMSERSDVWEHVLPRIERERALVRARASRATP